MLRLAQNYIVVYDFFGSTMDNNCTRNNTDNKK